MPNKIEKSIITKPDMIVSRKKLKHRRFGSDLLADSVERTYPEDTSKMARTLKNCKETKPTD